MTSSCIRHKRWLLLKLEAAIATHNGTSRRFDRFPLSLQSEQMKQLSVRDFRFQRRGAPICTANCRWRLQLSGQ